jgi:hypothetical protein
MLGFEVLGVHACNVFPVTAGVAATQQPGANLLPEVAVYKLCHPQLPIQNGLDCCTLAMYCLPAMQTLESSVVVPITDSSDAYCLLLPAYLLDGF